MIKFNYLVKPKVKQLMRGIERINLLRRIALTDLRIDIKKVRKRVLAGDAYICLHKNKVKAELVRANPVPSLNPPTQINVSDFRQNLTQCWRALESDPTHPGFVINLYGRP